MRRCFVLVILCMFLVGTLLFSSLDMVIPVPRNNERQTSYPKEEKPLSDEIRVGSREEKTDSHTFGGSWFQSRDTDFLECTLDDVQVVGHGPEARVDLAKKRSPGWQNMDPEVSPSGRYGHAMACNSIEGRVVLFGGYDRAYDSETWCYDTARNT